ncbi:MAG TPA: hypothetical protein VMV10_32800 [Pirellulales bacterium]|nr:hypothetical protein [Pirellulales bacterium]
MRLKPRRLAGAFFVSLLLASPSAARAAEDSADASVEDRGRYLLEGMAAERRKLHRGVYRCDGRKQWTTRLEVTFDRWFRIYSAFDDEADMLRFDRTQEYPILSNSVMTKDEYLAELRKPKESRKPSIPCINDQRYFRTKDKTALWQWLKGSAYEALPVVIKGPDNAFIPGSLDIFDVRGIGLYTWWYLSEHRPTLEEVFDPIKNGTVEKATAGGSGLQRVVVISAKGNRRTSIWIDEENGFTVPKLEDQYMDKQGEWLPASYVTETAWEKRSGVWVPTKSSAVMLLRAERGFAYGERQERFDFNFNWLDVGSPLDERIFTAEGLDVPKGTLVVDHRSTPPILEVIGDPDAFPKPRNPQSSSRLPAGFLLANAVALLLIVCVSYFTRRRAAP